MRLLIRVLVLLPLVLGTAAATEITRADAGQATAAAPGAGQSRADAAGRFVLIGVPGLGWDDVGARTTPYLWQLAAQGSAGALSVRTLGTLACPADGWLTVSAGARAARPVGICSAPPPTPARDATGESAVVPGFPGIRRASIDSKFQSPVGLFGEAFHRSGRCTVAAGPGAAFALADHRGVVDVYVPAPGDLTAGLLRRCPATAVEIGDVLRDGVGVSADVRAAAVRRADTAIGRILAQSPSGTTVLVAGLSDGVAGPARVDGPGLRVAIAAGPGITGGTLLGSDSTRRSGLVITPDITATLLRASGVPIPDDTIGTPWRSAERRAEGAAGVAALASHDVAAQTYRMLLPRFFLGLVITQVLFYALAAIALRRHWPGAGRRRVLAATRLVALACASVPVSTYLVNLLPWWHSGRPAVAMLAGIAVLDALVVVVALAGPWRRAILGPGTVVAAVTAVTVGVDLVTGTRLQLYSLMGYSPLVGGRYYGLGNIAFAVFATSVLLMSVGLAQWLLTRHGGLPNDADRGRAAEAAGRGPASADRPGAAAEAGGAAEAVAPRGRRWAVAVVAGWGITAMALDGLPAWGADFGGVIAIVPGLAVTVSMIAGRRASLPQLAGFCGVGGITVLLIAFLDYQRPPTGRTHLGRFFGDLLEGHAGPVVERKFGAMLHTIGNMTLTPIVIAALAFLFLILRRPDRLRAGALDLAYEQAPALRAGLLGALITAVVGFGVNDSGIAVLALALVVAVPLALTAGIQALRALPDAPPGAIMPPEKIAPDHHAGRVVTPLRQHLTRWR